MSLYGGYDDDSMSLDDLGLSDDEIVGVLSPLITLQGDPDFEAVSEASGVQIGVAYAVAKNCIAALAEAGDDDWIGELIREAYGCMSPEAQAQFAETGF